ncbi:MAG: T9SS type A sorting domain-containing protein [Bacteroidota bacterium]
MANRLRQSSRTSLKQTASRIGAAGLLIAAVFFAVQNQTTHLSGHINDYAEITELGPDWVRLNDASAFMDDDKVLLIQMKGAVVSTADDSTYGDVQDFGGAGNYEIDQIKEVKGDTLFFAHKLCQTYKINDVMQAVRIPVYQNAIVDGELLGQNWNGNTGGVLALEVSGTLTLQADLNVSGMGFRGGDLNGRAVPGNSTYICDFSSGKGGIKGEGIVEIPSAACRGKLANGGGGGNDHNAGGGGGSNYGLGGAGGHGWRSNSPGNLSDTDKGGRGGLALSNYYTPDQIRLFLGGGGGGGHQNNGASVPAANGGGIIILIANTLEVDQAVTIKANAPDATDVLFNDGAGGGGGGGTVLLQVDSYISPANLTIDVSGGDGASVHTRDQHGPGGGGGGGLINSPTAFPNAIQTIVAGGAAGLFVSSNTNHVHHNTSHGATGGANGGILTSLILPDCSAPPSLDLDGSINGEDYATTYQVGGSGVRISDLADVVVEDEDDTWLEFASIELTNPMNGADEGLTMDHSWDGWQNFGIQVSMSSDGTSVTLVGTATLSEYQEALNQIFYQNHSTQANLTTREIAIVVNDGGASSNVAMTRITMEEEILPVEWLDVQAKLSGNDGVIQWLTATESNASHYLVQRSADGREFETLGSVPAVGTTSDISEYEFVDQNLIGQPFQKLVYRLEQVDMDGAFSYSNLVELQLDFEELDLSLETFPNPATDVVNIEISSAIQGGARLQIVNLTGQKMIDQRLSGGQQSRQFRVADWSPGVYFVQLSLGKENLTRRLIVR